LIEASHITLRYGKRALFEDATIKFTRGNTYGIIGANGAGKSTFLKILSGEIEADKGEIVIEPGKRLAVLKQDHHEYDDEVVIKTVVMGHKKLYDIMTEKDAIYLKEDFSDEDGIRAGELEAEFAELNGWEAESDAAQLLSGLGIRENLHEKFMKDLEGTDKVRVLLAQALFGNPDILILDEPTNHLDVDSITWLESFLADFQNTVITVSHDRHFLNQVCTHICDIDYSKITTFVGNYDFWLQASELAVSQKRDANKKAEAKKKELEDFIRRFSANAAKSKQATSRKKMLDKIQISDYVATSRKYPHIAFKPSREAGKDILNINGLSKEIDGELLFKNLNLAINKGDKVAFVGANGLAKSTLFDILMGIQKADEGEFTWGVTIIPTYFPIDNAEFFEGVDYNLADWLRQFSTNKEETFVRGFLGQMLFSGEESQKKASVLSGGEKVRCMLSKMMLEGGNFLIMDEPTNHLDLESITSLNRALSKYDGTMFFVSQDHEFIQTVANRVIEITPKGVIDKMMSYDEYLENPDVQKLREEMYN
jgi:ATPase subunit of ABC transporter with duplicated ATPase domains